MGDGGGTCDAASCAFGGGGDGRDAGVALYIQHVAEEVSSGSGCEALHEKRPGALRAHPPRRFDKNGGKSPAHLERVWLATLGFAPSAYGHVPLAMRSPHRVRPYVMALMEHVFSHDRHAGEVDCLTRARGAWDASSRHTNQQKTAGGCNNYCASLCHRRVGVGVCVPRSWIRKKKRLSATRSGTLVDMEMQLVGQ